MPESKRKNTNAAPYRVLIARDSSAAATDLQAVLEAAGCKVAGLAQGESEALALVRELRPDCVFFALQLHSRASTSGIGALHTGHLAPVVVVSTCAQAEKVADAVAAGAQGFFSKPFSEKDIMPVLQVAISRFAEMRRLAEEVEDLQDKLETRKLIEQAKGILMQKGLSEAAALSRLQKTSMNSGRPLKDLAQALILSADLHAPPQQDGQP